MTRVAAFAFQLFVASAVSAAAAGMLLMFLLLFTTAAAEAESAGTVLAALLLSLLAALFVGGLAIFFAVGVAGLPAFCIGGVLWHLGRSRPRLRRNWPFAVTGAVTAMATYLFVAWRGRFPDLLDPSSVLGLSQPTVFLLFVLSGVVAGLVFRNCMYFVGRFVGDEEEEPEN